MNAAPAHINRILYRTRAVVIEMLERDYIFLSAQQFAACTGDIAAPCPRCASLARMDAPRETKGVIAGKMTRVRYLVCGKCGLRLCLPGTEDLGNDDHKERARRARHFEKTFDTRTHVEKQRVKKAIETRIRQWMADNDLAPTVDEMTGVDLRSLRHEALSKMHYGATEDLELVEPEIRTVGDVRRKLDGILERIVTEYPAFLEQDAIAARSWTTITRDWGTAPIGIDSN